MGIFSRLFRTRKPKRWKGRPLYRRGGRTYWKGTPIDDEEFTCDDNIEEIKAYNRYIRKHGKRIFRRHNKRRKRKTYYRTAGGIRYEYCKKCKRETASVEYIDGTDKCMECKTTKRRSPRRKRRKE